MPKRIRKYRVIVCDYHLGMIMKANNVGEECVHRFSRIQVTQGKEVRYFENRSMMTVLLAAFKSTSAKSIERSAKVVVGIDKGGSSPPGFLVSHLYGWQELPLRYE